MSFLNSIISSIGDGESSKHTQQPPSQSQKSAPAPNRPPPATSASLKRKADQREGLVPPKRPSVTSSPSPIPSRSRTTSPGQALGTAKPSKSTQPQKGPVEGARLPNTTIKPSNTSHVGATPGTSTSTPTAAPKKTGYLAILERAKAAQEAAKPLGQIKHQKTAEKDRLSRKERERRAAEAKQTRLQSSVQVDNKVRGGNTSKTLAQSNPPSGKRKVEVEYKGTMRPVAAKTAHAAGSRLPNSGGSLARPNHRYSEEMSEEDEDEDEGDYDSTSDMEAGRDEIDEEEYLSTLTAKREDEEARREEDELKRAKLERKRRLEMLTAAAAKKKKVY